jgi:phage baseplate assembly protein W
VDQAYLGKGWGFPVQFKHKGKVELVNGLEDIRQSLWILLSTNPGERIMHPSFGCGIKQHVFDTVDENTSIILKDTIKRAILFFEPRVKLDRIEIDIQTSYEGLLTIDLNYTVLSNNTPQNMVFPFYFRDDMEARE